MQSCLIAFLLCLWTATLAYAQPVDSQVRVASFNVENYLSMDRMVDGYWRRDYPKPEREKAAVRDILIRVNADVLALQEMGTADDLEELQRDLRHLGLDYPHAYLLHSVDEVRRTAVLSRLPFSSVHAHKNVDFAYMGDREQVKRGLLEVVFATEGMAWSLFVVHLKSRWTEHPDDPRAQMRRTREAQACRDLIRTRYPPETDPLYLVAGDLNDTRNAAPVRRFLQVGDTQLTQMVACADSRGERWTYHWERQDVYERIDYLLSSPALFDFVIEGRGWIYDAMPAAAQASDHRLIYLDLDFSRNAD